MSPLAAASFGIGVHPRLSLRCLLVARTGLLSLPTHFVRFRQSLKLSGSDSLIIEATACQGFCKSCIVRHFYYSNRCPKCNIVVHQTQPLYNIRLDRQLQDIVYKLVINLEEREKKQMHDFYKERGLEVPKPAVPQPVPSSKGRTKKVLESVFRIPPELDMSLLLEFIGANEGTGHFKPLEKKFVRVSGEATIGHVEKFLRRKMGLDPACQVDIICGDHLLERYQTLREIRRAIGDAAMQDGLLVLHYGLVVSPLKIT
ncbi:hypothetical protein E5288_WYG015103 [Bos mutus]|uniref:Polycomb group RING finger protein 6 n=1 Tax=Bos mutus TaxID=72004 RepID=A0A6B0RIG8_9CETA|nr:hypothetical protein [Bos mutus]